MDTNTNLANAKRDALAQRYGADYIPAAGPWNDVIAALLDHRSTRGFVGDALPAGTLETLIAAAQSAATSSNLQTWSVMAVTDPAIKAELATIANNQKHIEECPLFLVWLADLSRLGRISADVKTPFETLDWFETFMVAAIDAALAAQNASVAAESMGLANVYIGALRNNPQRVAELLGLPLGVVGVFGHCIGYAKPTAKTEVKPRLPQSVIVHHNKYDPGDEAKNRADYDQVLLEFSKRNEMAAGTWTDRLMDRAAKLKGMSGRHQMVGWLRSLGFPLK
jgi:nitroreductase